MFNLSTLFRKSLAKLQKTLELHADFAFFCKKEGETQSAHPLAVVLLMLLTKQIIHCLYGVESAEGYFHENGTPVAHSAIPKTW